MNDLHIKDEGAATAIVLDTNFNGESSAIALDKNDGSVFLDKKKEQGRIKSIDRFRGACVFCMIVFQFMKHFPVLGIFSRLANHNLKLGILLFPGMTIADIIAPAFIFAIGLTYYISYRKWEALYGKKRATVHFLERGLSILGLGCFFDACNMFLDGGSFLSSIDTAAFALTVMTIAVFVLYFLLNATTNLIKFISKKSKVTTVPKGVIKGFKFSTKLTHEAFYIVLSALGLLNLIIGIADQVTWFQHTGVGLDRYWTVLQGIGMACLIALPFVRFKAWQKFLAALAIFAVFSAFHQQPGNQEIIDIIPHGGAVGGVGWGAMLLFDMALADVFFKDKHKFFALSALFMAVGVWSTQFFGELAPGTPSPAFILMNPGLDGLIFCVFALTDKINVKHGDFLAWWGKNPIVMYLVEFFVVSLFIMIAPKEMVEGAPLWLAIIENIIVIVGLTAFTWLLARRKKSFSL